MPHIPNLNQFAFHFVKIWVVSTDLGGREGFDTGELQPPLTTPIGQDPRNWLWKIADPAKNHWL